MHRAGMPVGVEKDGSGETERETEKGGAPEERVKAGVVGGA